LAVKTIGLLGGMSWESTSEYYRIINQTVRDRMGPLNSAQIAMVSVEFAEIERLMLAEKWDEVAAILIAASQGIERAGAEFLLICTNTMHKLADQIQAAIGIPILHIADSTAAAIHTRGISKVALLATSFTMEEDFYRGRLSEKHGLEVLIPEAQDRQTVHRIIFDELCAGRIEAASKAAYLDIIERLIGRGAEGVILGCTEIGILIKPEDLTVPVFDTTRIHAIAAVDRALSE
jgi:amino-acid racemase